MISLSSTLLFAASASAQLTTSFWAARLGYNGWVGFQGSVINVQDARTTLQLSYDNRTDTEYVVFPLTELTMTVGPTIWETGYAGTSTAGSGADFFTFHCEKNNPSVETANATCAYTFGHQVATSAICGPISYRPRTSYALVTRTYSASGTFSVGVETVTEVSTRTQVPSRSTPAWCTESNAPDASYVTSGTIANNEFGTFQVVITAGTEKLKATQGASISSSAATPTGSAAPTGSVTVSKQSGAALPMRTAAPMAVGLGAAIAAFIV